MFLLCKRPVMSSCPWQRTPGPCRPRASVDMAAESAAGKSSLVLLVSSPGWSLAPAAPTSQLSHGQGGQRGTPSAAGWHRGSRGGVCLLPASTTRTLGFGTESPQPVEQAPGLLLAPRSRGALVMSTSAPAKGKDYLHPSPTLCYQATS